MKIVISISKENYEYIKKHANEEVLPVGWHEIIKGLPLPESRESIDKTRAKIAETKARVKHENN